MTYTKHIIILIILQYSFYASFGQLSIDAKYYYSRIITAKEKKDYEAFKTNFLHLETLIEGKSPSEMDDSTLYYYATSLYYAGYYNVDLKTNPYSKAIPYFQYCADKGSYDCSFYLGRMYQIGLGIEKNVDIARKYLERAALGGNMEAWAKNNLGIYYQDVKDYKTALKFYNLSASLGFGLAYTNIGWLNYNGHGVPQDYQKAFDNFKNGETYNDVKQNYALGLGHCYSLGRGTSIDYNKGIFYYKIASNLGIGRASGRIGQMYELGQGVTQNFDSAIYYYQKGSQNDGWSANELAFFYGNNLTFKNYDSVIKYSKLAISMNENWGYNNLAWAYNELDYSETSFLDVVEKGFNTNDEIILPNLTALYSAVVINKQLKDEYEKVFNLLKKYEDKDSDGFLLNNLGVFYNRGLYVKRDDFKAAKYFRAAKEKGNKLAAENLKTMGIGRTKEFY
ncbi:MAG: sel1 repeat family protein [Bacteroidetes bacterium]|nr:sel1 repeat family protein [Bacteroidota bacterium]